MGDSGAIQFSKIKVNPFLQQEVSKKQRLHARNEVYEERLRLRKEGKPIPDHLIQDPFKVTNPKFYKQDRMPTGNTRQALLQAQQERAVFSFLKDPKTSELYHAPTTKRLRKTKLVLQEEVKLLKKKVHKRKAKNFFLLQEEQKRTKERNEAPPRKTRTSPVKKDVSKPVTKTPSPPAKKPLELNTTTTQNGSSSTTTPSTPTDTPMKNTSPNAASKKKKKTPRKKLQELHARENLLVAAGRKSKPHPNDETILRAEVIRAKKQKNFFLLQEKKRREDEERKQKEYEAFLQRRKNKTPEKSDPVTSKPSPVKDVPSPSKDTPSPVVQSDTPILIPPTEKKEPKVATPPKPSEPDTPPTKDTQEDDEEKVEESPTKTSDAPTQDVNATLLARRIKERNKLENFVKSLKSKKKTTAKTPLPKFKYPEKTGEHPDMRARVELSMLHNSISETLINAIRVQFIQEMRIRAEAKKMEMWNEGGSKLSMDNNMDYYYQDDSDSDSDSDDYDSDSDTDSSDEDEEWWNDDDFDPADLEYEIEEDEIKIQMLEEEIRRLKEQELRQQRDEEN